MSIDSGPEDADMTPGLREHISVAAEKIRADHNAELADVMKADSAVRLFRSIVHPNGSEEPSTIPGQGVGSLAAEFGALLGDAVRTGTELVAIPVAALAQEWMANVLGPAAKPNPATDTPHPQAAVNANVPEFPAVSPEETRLRDVFRRFMPMLVFSLNQGGTGYGLAEKVIALFGRSTYEQASAIGKDRMLAILKSERDVWDQVAPIEDKFSRFLDEFLAYDAYVEKNQKR